MVNKKLASCLKWIITAPSARHLQTHQSQITIQVWLWSKVLESHLFLKKKSDQTIKGRMVACGNKQRNHINKTDATLPTSDLEHVLLTSKIDAKEGGDVVIVDIPNAFVTTRIEKKYDIATIRLWCKSAELLVTTAPEIYKKYVTLNRKGELVLYVESLNALYGKWKGHYFSIL